MASKRKPRSETPAGVRQHRLTMADVVQQLITAQAHRAVDHSSVKLTRNAKGDVQIEVHVRTGEHGIETVDDASVTAQQIFNFLEDKYPPPAAGA